VKDKTNNGQKEKWKEIMDLGMKGKDKG